jgi:hypothetical protein
LKREQKFQKDLLWFHVKARLKNLLEERNIPKSYRGFLQEIEEGIEVTEGCLESFPPTSDSLTILDRVLKALEEPIMYWPSRLLRLYGPSANCLALPYIDAPFSFHEHMTSIWPWWPKGSKHLLIPIEPTVHDSPLDVTSLARLLDIAWSLEGEDRARRGSLLLAPALAIEEGNWPRISYSWASSSALPWNEGIKNWIESNLVKPSTTVWLEDEDIALWPWEQICWASSQLLSGLPPCQRGEGPVEIASVLAAGLMVCAYLSSSGHAGGFEEIEKLVAFACDASIFVATYNRRKSEHERRL